MAQRRIRETSVIDTSISGHCEPGYGAVADLLRTQLDRRPDSGASIGVYRDGRPVVALWGGMADARHGRRWTERTVTPLASTSKALASVALLTLVERGLVDLDRPVAAYWPDFGQAGKADIPVHLVLSHRSGVAALDEPVTNDEAAALDPVLRRLERQRPWWPPGTRHGYHAVTYGFLVSGLVRSVTGLTVGRLFARDVAGPLGLDLYIGLPPGTDVPVAPMIGPSHRQALAALVNPVWLRYALVLLDRRSVAYHATFGGTAVSFDDHAELQRFEVEDASAGAVGHGPALARMFAALVGPVDGRRLIGPELLDRVRQRQASGRDAVLGLRTDWALGFTRPGGPLWPDPGVPGLFGQVGASGSLAFADPEHGLAFGYAPSLWAELSRPFRAPRYRFAALTEAVYRSAGIRPVGGTST